MKAERRNKEVNFLVIEERFNVTGMGVVYLVRFFPKGAILHLGDTLLDVNGESFEIERIRMIRFSPENEEYIENHVCVQFKKDSRLLEKGEVLAKNAKLIKIHDRFKIRKVGVIYTVNLPKDVDVLMGDILIDRDENNFIVKGISMASGAGQCSKMWSPDILLESEDIDEVVGNELIYIAKSY